MTAPEPLTLERFIKDVANEYPRGGLVWRNDPSIHPRKVWVILDKFGDEGVRQTDYARRWEDLVEQFYGQVDEQFYGHPVRAVARNEAAELKALVRENLAGIAPYLQALSWNPRLTSEDSRNLEEAASRIASSLDAFAASKGQS